MHPPEYVESYEDERQVGPRVGRLAYEARLDALAIPCHVANPTLGLGAPAIVVQCIGKCKDGKDYDDTDEDGEELPAFADIFVVNHNLGNTLSF